MSKLNLNAKLVTKRGGYDSDKKDIDPYEVGTVFEVESVSMGQSSTDVKMKDKGWFNSIYFEFIDDRGRHVDIFNDPRFNPYLECGY